jgi:hypothetical protein
MPLQIFFFAQDLTVNQPHGRNEINQADPIWKYEKFANQDHRKRDIDGIAAKGKNAVHDKLVGLSVSMPIRKLCLKEIRLHNNKKRPARQNRTPAHATASEWKNGRALILGQSNAAANRK